MKELRFDWERQERTGVPEVVFAQGKSVEQLAELLGQAQQQNANLLLTRLEQSQFDALGAQAESLNYDPISHTAIFGAPLSPVNTGSVAVVCAGTSDWPIACEAQRSLQYFGVTHQVYADVGVAGLWRLMSIQDELQQHAIVIAVAGMEGALFSVVAGLVRSVVIAVPTSVGYGVARDGQAALSSALASCAPGVVTVNIDNGFGAAAAARKILLNQS